MPATAACGLCPRRGVIGPPWGPETPPQSLAGRRAAVPETRHNPGFALRIPLPDVVAIQGRSYASIAAELGCDELHRLEGTRLDALQAAWWDRALDGNARS